MLEILLALKKLILLCRPLRTIGFKFEYLGEFKVEFKTALGYETRGFWWKKNRVKKLVRLSL
jgi:hypothetical protein